MASIKKRFEVLRAACESDLKLGRGSQTWRSQEDPDGAEAVDELIALGLLEQVGEKPASGSTSFRKNMEGMKIYANILKETDPDTPEEGVLAKYLE